MDATQNIKLKFPLEDQPIVGYLGKFTLAFVQALFKTGYFQPGHPGLGRAKQDLYDEWIHLSKKGREISFMISDLKGEPGILVYGILAEITPLKELFSVDMAESLVAKFRGYFDRSRLVSLTIKPEISFEAFQTFIDLMSEPPNTADLHQGIVEINEKTIHRQLFHASTVYQEERIKEIDSLSWITQVLLTRFDKELRFLSLYKDLTLEQKTILKSGIFKGILHSLSDISILKEVLIHSDRVKAEDAAGRIDMEREISGTLLPDQIWTVLSECVSDLQKVSPRAHPEINDEETLSRYQRLVFIVKQLTKHLSSEKMAEGSEELIEVLIQEEIVVLETLPDSVIKRIELKRLADGYLKEKQACWAMLQDGADDARLKEMILILPVLFGRNDFQSFGELFDQLQVAFRKKINSDSEFYSAVGIEGLRANIVSKLQDRQLANRKDLFLILEPFARPLASSLLPFCTHEDILLRRNVCRILAKVGQEIIPDLIALAKETRQSWQVIRNVVMVLGDIGVASEPVLNFLRRCQLHPRPNVREEVIASFGKIKGKQAEGFLLQELENKDKALVGRAVIALGGFNPVSEKFLSFLRETLRKKQKNEAQSDERVEVNSTLAIEAIAAFDFQTAQSFESILCQAITPEKSRLLGLMGDKYHEKEYEVRKAICRLLGVIGTIKVSLPVLKLLLSEKPWLPEDKDLVQQAMKKIEQRVE